MSRLLVCMLATIFSVSSYSAVAEESDISVGLFAGLTFGGDEIAEIEYEDGSDASIDAGGLVYFGGDIRYRSPDIPLDVQFNLGYHTDSSNAENGDTSFDRIVVEAIPFYRIDENHRIGAGISYHLSPEFEIDFDGMSDTVDFDNALGLVLEYGYNFDSIDGTLALRYNLIDYEPSSINGTDIQDAEDIDGSHVGILYYIHF